jgi:hypothetical protein
MERQILCARALSKDGGVIAILYHGGLIPRWTCVDPMLSSGLPRCAIDVARAWAGIAAQAPTAELAWHIVAKAQQSWNET